MSAVDEMGLGEVGVVASEALREILARAVGGSPVASYVNERPLSWDSVRQGDWDMLGAAEEDGGAGASLRDLVELARVWGSAVVPSPLVPTLMAKRWSPAARACAGPVTVSVPTRASGGRAVTPFGVEPDVRVLLDTEGDGVVAKFVVVGADPYAPSLRLAEGGQATTWSGVAAAELRVVWAAEATGCASRMLGDAVAYVKERQQFGQPIGRFQAIKHHLANAHLLAEQAETAVILASLEPERAPAASRFAFDASLRVIEIAVQVHGGLGFTWEMGLHMYLRHVSALRELAAGLPA
ncbi:MAG: hypothetical protein JWQ99_757 [Blastococcus sp.]|nr:hypothetical protein [Blastococcus sp.]